MSEIKKVRRCLRCGAPIQSEDPLDEGYLSPETARLEGRESLLCSSCYKEANWNDNPSREEVSDSLFSIIESAKEEKALFLYMIDVFSFEAAFIERISRAIDGEKILILANKRDLLPPNIDIASLKDYIAHQFHVNGIHSVTADDVFLSSISLNSDISLIVKEMNKRRKNHNVYLIGAAKSGKSAFINAFLLSYKNDSGRAIAGLLYKQSGIQAMEIPLDRSSSLFDVPGFPNDNSIFGHKETPKEAVLPDGEPVKAVRNRLEKKGSLFIGLLGHLDYVKGERKSVPSICYFAKKVDIKKIFPKRDINALFDKYIEKKVLKPRLPSLHSNKDYDAFEFAFDKNEVRDFGIAGLGWVSVEGQEGEVYHLYVPKGIGAYVTRPKIVPAKKKEK